VQFTKSDPNSRHILNPGWLPVLQHASIPSRNAAASNPFISGIPSAVEVIAICLHVQMKSHPLSRAFSLEAKRCKNISGSDPIPSEIRDYFDEGT
jgi:hypothetical protein